ncbi:hypothetical protein Tco_1199886 [Tanacetum coccineum]
MRDFHKTHPSGFGVVKIIPSVTSKGTGVKPGVPNVTKEESYESKVKSWGNDEDDSNNEQDSSGEDSHQENDSDNDKTQSDNDDESNSEHETDKNESGSESDQEENEENEENENDEEAVKDELVKTPSNDSDNEDETKITDKAEGDEDEEMDYTTSQLYDDGDIRLNEPVDTDNVFIQEGIDAAMTNTEVPVTSSSHSSDLAAKFLNFLDIPHIDAEIVSPMHVHVHHEVPSFTTPPQQSTSTPPPTTEATNPLSTLTDFASVF